MQFVLGILLMAQLSLPPGADLPQVMTANFKPPVLVKAGKKADIAVSFSVIKPYVINRSPEISLKLTEGSGVKLGCPSAAQSTCAVKLTEVSGVKLMQAEIIASPKDPKSKDEYFVDLPVIHVSATAAKAGKYEVPGKLKYYFCHKTSGFCSVQTVDVKIPLQVQ